MTADLFVCNFFDWVRPLPPKRDIFMEILAAEDEDRKRKGGD